MKKYLKIASERLKNTKAQALLMVMIVAMFSLALVLGVVERTNKQLSIQRQNAEYQFAFSNALGAVTGLKALIDSGDIIPGQTYTPDQINAKLNTANFLVGLKTTDFKLNLLQFDSTATAAANVPADSNLVVEPFVAEKTDITKIKDTDYFTIVCPQSIPELALNIQVYYRDSSAGNPIKIDNLSTTCQENISPPKKFDGGTYWAWAPDTTVQIAGTDAYKVSGSTSGGKVNLKYDILTSNRKKVIYVKVIPKIGTAIPPMVPLLVQLYSSSQLSGTSTPIQGIAVGYGLNGRTSTINFTIPNTPSLPSYFDYVMFEGS